MLPPVVSLMEDILVSFVYVVIVCVSDVFYLLVYAQSLALNSWLYLQTQATCRKQFDEKELGGADLPARALILWLGSRFCHSRRST